jgi:hypothetical protein
MDAQTLLLEAMNDIKKDIRSIKTDVSNLKIEVAVLKTKAAVWGSLAGSVPVIIFSVIKMFIK